MVLAEAPMIDPGFIILLLTIVAVIAAGGIALVVVTIVAGYRHGRDPSNRRARTVWTCGLLVQALIAATSLASGDVVWLTPLVLAFAVSLAARWVGAPTPRPPTRR